jgi:2,3-bisphosphoglycerate-independent phosphoglycerate mutase
MNKKKPLVLIVIDGLGVAMPNKGNAVTLAKTVNFDGFWPKYNHTYLEASGNYVGLPRGVVGNSEVGHMSLGAGRIILQEIARIDDAIKNKTFFENETFKEALSHAKKTGGDMHFMGLVSDGKVHSSLDHLLACLEFCQKEEFPGERVFVHAFTDGRDTNPDSAEEYLEQVDIKCRSLNLGKIATIIGRHYAMDRDKRWERTQLAYEMLVQGKGKMVGDWREAIRSSYSEDLTDEYIEPHIVSKDGQPITQIKSGDSLIFFNYRPDRAVQISKAFILEDFSGFDRELISDLYYAGFSNYQKGVVMNRAKEDEERHGGESQMVEALFEQELKKSDDRFPPNQIFPPEKVEESLGKVISDAGLSQLRISESEKYPHVTYFFNCRKKNPFEREERIEIPSPRDVKTYDQKPEMSSYELTARLKEELKKNIYDFVLLNFASTDMVAHTGNLEASIKAVEVVDRCIGDIAKEVLSLGGQVLITADHGNVEEMLNLQTDDMDTKHSINQVPFMLLSDETNQGSELAIGMLADIAPTVLRLMKIDLPASMTGRDLSS